jgi:ankyrin repeat protein
LHYAVIEYQVDIVNLLIINGADVNATDNNGNSIFFAAIFYSKGKGDVINILNTNKANPFLENNNGISALSLAKSITNYNNMQFLNAYLN